jgi:spore germination protein YaaH
MPDRQIFFDPQRKRWKRLRRILDISAVVFTLVLAGFIFNVLRFQRLPELLLPVPKHNYKALPDIHPAHIPRPARRKTDRKPSDIPFNTGEGLRAAYYIPDDAASYSSLKEHIHQIDLLFPQWLHAVSPQGTLVGNNPDTHRDFAIVDASGVHDPDDGDKVKHVIQAAKEDTEVYPHLNNFNSATQSWDPGMGGLLKDPGKRAALRSQIVRFFTAYPVYRGLSLDFENLPDDATPAYLAFIRELNSDLHHLNVRLLVNAAIATPDAELKAISANSDGIILMNYDQHQTTSDPGPIAAQDWFVGNLTRVLKVVPKEKIICAVGNYGYDWTLSATPPDKKGSHNKPARPQVLATDDFSVSEAWQRASDADADLDLDYDTLNPHFEFVDEDTNQRHVVWFLDGVTILNELRAARQLGLQTFALWRLGWEDNSMWNIWDKPSNPDSLQALNSVQPGHDIDIEGEGDIMRVTGLPQPGRRTVSVDTDETNPQRKLIIDEHMDVYPRDYTVTYYGYHPNEVAISFDDGPDPKWTPRILDILKRKNVKGTFMLIGMEAAENVGVMNACSGKATRSATTPTPIPTSAKFHPAVSTLRYS